MYTMKDLYPNMYHTSTADTSIPEPDEQKVLQQIDNNHVAPVVVDKKQKTNFVGLIILLIAIMVILSV